MATTRVFAMVNVIPKPAKYAVRMVRGICWNLSIPITHAVTAMKCDKNSNVNFRVFGPRISGTNAATIGMRRMDDNATATAAPANE